MRQKFRHVSLPVMPIGVEHFWKMSPLTMLLQVSLPVMPIGVEHAETWFSKNSIFRVATCDADRR